MNRFNTEELKALRKSAAALNRSDYEVTKRLENAYDHVLLMLEALHDQSSNQTLHDIDDGIDVLIERLADTQTILRLVLRERELENKLASLGHEEPAEEAEQEMSLKDRILAKLQSGEPIFQDMDGNDLELDPAILKRIEQRQQLESLVDTLYPSEQAQKIKKILAQEISTISRASAHIKIPRPWRDLDASIPTAKGKGYELPKNPTEDR